MSKVVFLIALSVIGFSLDANAAPCPRLEGVKGCTPPTPPPTPPCTPPSPDAGKTCTGTAYSCTTGNMDVKYVTNKCINPHQVCTTPPPSETTTQPVCSIVCDGYESSCTVKNISCNNCTTTQVTGVVDNCGKCVVTGNVNPGNSCSANETCP